MHVMKALNQKAQTVFAKLIDGMANVGDHRKIDNTNGTYMPVVVEVIGKPDFGSNFPLRPEARIVSICHYFEQNGDLCQDPEMTFLVGVGTVYPMTFLQAIPPVSQVAAEFEDGKLRFNERLQRELVTFANQWMANIAEQQF